jgi:5'-3' exonuclease
MYTNLVVDLNNLCFLTRFGKVKTPSSVRQKEKDIDKYIFIEVVDVILKYMTMFKCTGLIIVMDSPNGWRKELYPDYKRSDREIDIYFNEIVNGANLVFDFFRNYTAALCLKAPRCEADDIISVITRISTTESIILSTDKDYVQLISPLVRLYTPMKQGSFRESDNPKFDLFLKCIRGDTSDNIRSALPRIREAVLRDAFEEQGVKLLNLMETVRPDGVKVLDAYKFNESLIDLTKQPDNILEAIENAIIDYEFKRYSVISAIKFIKDLGFAEQKLTIFDRRDAGLKKPPVLVL